MYKIRNLKRNVVASYVRSLGNSFFIYVLVVETLSLEQNFKFYVKEAFKMSSWDSKQYLKFSKERTQPAIDLANRIEINPQSIIDIGCGPGNSTAVLAGKFPNAKILGIDNSENMIISAKKNYPNIEFMLCDAENGFADIERKFDVVFSNACIQWIPNHEKLLNNMMSLLNKDGILAIQTPMNYEEPIHKIIVKVTKGDKWKDKFPNPRIFYNLMPSEYYDILSDISADFSMWTTTYFHRMKSHNDIMEWYRGTGSRPYISVLNENDKLEFEKDILEEVIKAYPKQKNGEIIFRFPRFFFIARK